MLPNHDNIKVFSFDIFDTTVTRAVADPRDVFRLMQKTLSNDAFKEFPVSIRSNFAALRCKAALHARLEALAQGKEDIGIVEIYKKLQSFCPLNETQCRQLMELEFQQELDCIYPVAWTIKEINNLRERNKRIVFSSDMYLPLEVIEKILIKTGAFVPSQDRIYLSNKVGAGKYNGKLFKYILENEHCLPQELCHYGDDMHSDVYMPAKMGIRHFVLDDLQRQKVLRFRHLERIKDYFNKLFF